jgi:poly-beta-1,6-N-acetyl-D-glucosamine synthase
MNESGEAASQAGRYVLITAAYNEETHIERTLESVIAQTLLPRRWVIVSDGSTDRTDNIVRDYASRFDVIRFIRRERENHQGFASKVFALRAGRQFLAGDDYEFIGHLDADVSFGASYFHDLLARFHAAAALGIAGGFICEESNGEFVSRPANSARSVPGAVQMFRRQCYEAIGEILPIEYGGEDWYAEVAARMKGWHVEAFPELQVYHHRRTGTARGLLRSWYRQGLMDFSLGSHPLFEIAKLLRRVPARPLVLGALARLCGFVSAYLRGNRRMVSREFQEFLRKDEMARLWPIARTHAHESRPG